MSVIGALVVARFSDESMINETQVTEEVLTYARFRRVFDFRRNNYLK